MKNNLIGTQNKFYIPSEDELLLALSEKASRSSYKHVYSIASLPKFQFFCPTNANKENFSHAL